MGVPVPPPVTLRPFAAADIDAMAHIHSRACEIAYAFMHWSYTDADVRDWMRSKLASWDWGLVGEANGQLVGYLLMSGSHVDQLFVLPGFQGQGMGRRLLGAALGRGLRPLTLNVFAENGRARRFYERHGFREAARWHNTDDNAVELRYLLA